MKKRMLSLLMAVAVSLTCVGCKDAASVESTHEFSAEDFSMRIDNPYVTTHSTELFYTISVLNDVPDAEITYGESFVIERQNEDGSWTRALPAGEYAAFTLVEYHIYGRSVCESAAINNDVYGSLSEGHYRLVKYINDDIPVTAEFDVTPSDIGFELFGADNVTTETPWLKYSFTYHGDGTRTYTCGESYDLEKRDENGEWKNVTFVENFMFPAVGYILSREYPERELAFSVDSFVHDPPLTAGEYRISAEIFNDEKLITQDSHLLYERFSAEFTIR